MLQYQPLQEYLDMYLGLQQFVVPDPTPVSTGAGDSPSPYPPQRLSIVAENDGRKLHCTLRDLSSLLQALGRLANHFIADRFMDSFADAICSIEYSGD